jgi:hypothetical protein
MAQAEEQRMEEAGEDGAHGGPAAPAEQVHAAPAATPCKRARRSGAGAERRRAAWSPH